ncbi:uncharacterized protein K02A2.6-like [Tachysurus ichikawai]
MARQRRDHHPLGSEAEETVPAWLVGWQKYQAVVERRLKDGARLPDDIFEEDEQYKESRRRFRMRQINEEQERRLADTPLKWLLSAAAMWLSPKTRWIFFMNTLLGAVTNVFVVMPSAELTDKLLTCFFITFEVLVVLCTALLETMSQVHEQLRQRQKKQKQHYDRIAKYIADLQPGEGIRMQKGDPWKPAVVLEKHEQPRSFIVKTPDGKLFRRNRRHLRKTRETHSSTFEKSVDMDTDSQQSVNASQNNALDSKDITNERNRNESVEKEQAYHTRSGRIVKIPEKYKD